MINQLNYNIYLGSDPEAFLEREGRIIGSEKVIPQTWPKNLTSVNTGLDLVTRDGVQIELHPYPATSPQDAVSKIRNIMNSLFNYVSTLKLATQVSFKELVEVERDELNSLSPENRILGCQPSKNIYKLKKASVDGAKYRKRSAGGHLHFGLTSTPILMNHKDYRIRLPYLMDVIVGNTCVMLDQDKGQVERRKVYGQAGEYRNQKYGLEYRTLSNFWLRSPVLAELVFGLGYMAVEVLLQTLNKSQDLEKELLENIDYKKVIRAIQLNDLKLAMDNWGHVSKFIAKNVTCSSILNASSIPQFEKFIGIANVNGLDKFFPADHESVRKAWTTTATLGSFLGGING